MFFFFKYGFVLQVIVYFSSSSKRPLRDDFAIYVFEAS